MARPTIITQCEKETTYTLSNKPEYICVMDTKDYKEIVENSTCWFVHINRTSRKPAPYIRRSIRVGKKTMSYYLHTEICPPKKCDHVTDHINRVTIDNRRVNLRSVTYTRNALNKVNNNRNRHYMGCSIFKRERGESYFYQVYRKKKYITCGKTLAIVKDRIKKKLEANNE